MCALKPPYGKFASSGNSNSPILFSFGPVGNIITRVRAVFGVQFSVECVCPERVLANDRLV